MAHTKKESQSAPNSRDFLTKQGENVTRTFCEKMIAAKKIDRKEDIELMHLFKGSK